MKKFNLELALQGKPVQTRNGKPVTKLIYFDAQPFSLVGVVEGSLNMWTTSGSNDVCYEEDDLDLFMAEEEMYIALTPEEAMELKFSCGARYLGTTYQEVRNLVSADCIIFKLVKVEDEKI